MKSRRQARQVVLQVLYSCDTLDDFSVENVEFVLSTTYAGSDEEISEVDQENLGFVRMLLETIIKNRPVIDEAIAKASDHWAMARMARVDRNILRIGTAEVLCLSDIPVKVSINEAVELTKAFGSNESPTFVNGVLDKIASCSIRALEIPAKLAINQ